ncbi:MAG: hypothetical protein ACFB0B_09165 [Thermonemataceae bacterium]
MHSIKDLIYFDLEKARSLISQLKGELISEVFRAFEDENEINSGVGFDLKLFKGNTGGKEKDKKIRTEKIEVYHELLNQIESELDNKELLTDLNKSFDSFDGTFDDFMKLTPEFSFIKANGWSRFEDFERLKNIFSNFNEIQRLVFSSQLLENTEIQEIQKKIKDAKKGVEKLERNQRAKELAKLKSLEAQFDKKLQEVTDIRIADETFIERMKLLFDTFSPNRLNFRLLPLDNFSNFQILSNLKEKYLIDSNFESIIYTYGTRPNIKLSIFGIITSCPRPTDDRVDLSEEFLAYGDNELNKVQTFDKAFRNVFQSFEEFEKFLFVPTYPKLAISPVAIYREVQYKKS